MPTSDRCLEIGRKLARAVFERRGNRSEAHITEAELAGLLALAAELGALPAVTPAGVTASPSGVDTGGGQPAEDSGKQG